MDFFSAQHRTLNTATANQKKIQAALNQRMAQRTQPSHQQENSSAQKQPSVEKDTE